LSALGGALRVVRWAPRLNRHRTSRALAQTLSEVGTGQREPTTNRATGRYPRVRLPTLSSTPRRPAEASYPPIYTAGAPSSGS